MTTQETIDDILTDLAHALRQREVAAREWERQARQWEAQCREMRRELDKQRDSASYLAGKLTEVDAARLSLERQLAEAHAALAIKEPTP